MNRLLMLRAVLPRAGINFSTSTRSQMTNKIKESQNKFQRDDGLPVHLKGGLTDKLSYMTIMIMSAVGTVWGCYALYDMATPKK